MFTIQCTHNGFSVWFLDNSLCIVEGCMTLSHWFLHVAYGNSFIYVMVLQKASYVLGKGTLKNC